VDGLDRDVSTSRPVATGYARASRNGRVVAGAHNDNHTSELLQSWQASWAGTGNAVVNVRGCCDPEKSCIYAAGDSAAIISESARPRSASHTPLLGGAARSWVHNENSRAARIPHPHFFSARPAKAAQCCGISISLSLLLWSPVIAKSSKSKPCPPTAPQESWTSLAPNAHPAPAPAARRQQLA
jgi:hypothetical protein